MYLGPEQGGSTGTATPGTKLGVWHTEVTPLPPPLRWALSCSRGALSCSRGALSCPVPPAPWPRTRLLKRAFSTAGSPSEHFVWARSTGGAGCV